MVGNKLKLLLKKMAISLLICITLLGGITINTYAKTSDNLGIAPFQINESSITYEKNLPNIEDIIKINKNQEKPSVLIYHSHSQETYKDWDIIKAGEYLTDNLELLGVSVTHVKEDFSGENGYNKSYSSSREYIKNIVKDYDLIIDLHIDATADDRLMWVLCDDINTYKQQKTLVDDIKDIISKDYVKSDTIYNEVIRNKSFNLDLSERSMLIEIGGYKNTKTQVVPLLDRLSEGINTYLKSK